MGKVSTAPDEVEFLRPLQGVFGTKADKREQLHDATGKGDDPNV